MIAYYEEKRDQTRTQTVSEIVGRVNIYSETQCTPATLTEALPKILNTPAGTRTINETLHALDNMRAIAQKMHEKSHWQQFNKGGIRWKAKEKVSGVQSLTNGE